MATLNAEQRAQVEQWAAEGANLNGIQDRLKAEFDITLTYLEARLLMMELEVTLRDLKAEEAKRRAEQEAVEKAKAEAEAAQKGEDEGGDPANATGFMMEEDVVTVPGTLVSGSAAFSDGMRAKWSLDSMGRLSLKADAPGYQPPAEDVPKFQRQLEKILAKKGLY